MALAVGHPFKKYNSKITKCLLQISVVGLGFGMNIGEAVAANWSAFYSRLNFRYTRSRLHHWKMAGR